MKFLQFRKAQLLLLMMLGLAPGTLFRDPYVQQKDPPVDQETDKLMQIYQDDLRMTVEEAVLFRNKAAEFAIRRNKVKAADMAVKEKLALLRQLSKQETAEMGNLLTLPQLRHYKKLKKIVQPVWLVAGEVN